MVLEIGRGSGLLTKRLVEAGHRVIAADASPAMLDLTRDAVGGAADVRTLGSYRREDEHHGNVLIETSPVPELLRERGVTATVSGSFNDDRHPLPTAPGFRRTHLPLCRCS